MREADWHITDTLVQRVQVLRESDTQAQVTARQGVIWVPKTELTEAPQAA